MEQPLQIDQNSHEDVVNCQRKIINKSGFFYFFTQLIAWGNSFLLEGLLLAWELSAIMEWACPVRLGPSKGLRK